MEPLIPKPHDLAANTVKNGVTASLKDGAKSIVRNITDMARDLSVLNGPSMGFLGGGDPLSSLGKKITPTMGLRG